jgi:LCP family protein required for cell wall assembly
MRTTLKRGVGRGASLSNGKNGHAVFPPSAVSSVVRYKSLPGKRSGLGLVGRILLVALLAIVGVAIAVAGAAFIWFHETVSGLRAHTQAMKIAQKQLAVTLPGHAAIGLIIGYDARSYGVDASNVSRSDTVMLVRADPVTKSITLLSIPRDLGVPIYCPKQAGTLGVQKINQAYADCGPGGTVDTVKHLTGFPINYVIRVNFRGFTQIVDKLGGIWLNIDRRYYHVNNGSAVEDYSNINLQPGYQLLDGSDALSFVRYRHTDDDYHRIARQQEFIKAFKDELEQKLSLTDLPPVVSMIEHNVEVAGDASDKAVLGWALFLLNLPGGHFIQDRIENVTGASMTSVPQQDLNAALNEFIHPNVGASKVANNAALGTKPKAKNVAPPASKTSVLVLNGNGVAGSAANGSYELRQKGYVTVLPPGNALPNAPSQGYFKTQVYYDPHQTGSKAAADKLAKLFVPSNVGPLPKDKALRALDPGAMETVIVGQTYHNQLVAQPKAPPTPQHVAPQVAYEPSVGLGLLQPIEKRAGFKLENPTVLESSSTPDNQYGDIARRMYWMDKTNHYKGVVLVFKTSTDEYWDIQETDMPNPPILSDKSFQHSVGGREMSLYYSGSNLQMVVLRDGNRSYWVENTLLDDLSNETMLAIAKGLRPLPAPKK